MYDACAGEVWTQSSFTHALFQGWGVRSEVLLEQVQLNFSFRNKFIILVPCGPLVDNNTFSKMCVFKSPTVYTDDGGFENKNAHFFNNEFTGNEELMMVILNFTLLHYQNGGLAVRHPYLMVCCKNVI